ncbi:autotransporter family protein [Desulfotalea psychrophila]|nr:autotransporter outer membrane beta-barrel domain-containing protein [Desulfotalea psychrophila]
MKDAEKRDGRKVYATRSALAGLLALSMGATNAWAGVTFAEKGGDGTDKNPFYYALATGTAINTTPIKHGTPAGPMTRNGGDIFIYGIKITGGNLDNKGEIRIHSKNDTGSTNLLAIKSTGDASSTIQNEANIELEAKGGSSTSSSSAYTFGIMGEITRNEGNMTIRSTGGTLTAASAEASAEAGAAGIGSYGDLYNQGRIEVVAQAGRYSADGGATYQSDSATALGILFAREGTLDSRAPIAVQARGATNTADSERSIFSGTEELKSGKFLRAYQVLTYSALTIKGYSMVFNNQEEVDEHYRGAIGTIGDGTATFAPDAVLYVFTDNNFAKATTYKIPTLVEDAAISDQFTSAQLALTSPDYRANLVDGDGKKLQQLAIAYAPEVSTPLVSAQVNQKILASGTTIVRASSLSPMLAKMERSNPRASAYDGVLLASTSPVLAVPDMEILPQKRGWAFAMPYYSNVSNNASPMGYDADIYGATAGYNHWIDSDLILGFHAGYGSGDINYTGKGYEQKKENLKAGSLGVQSLYRFADDWLLQSIASFYYSSNDYSDNNPLNREQGDYHGYGVNANLDLDYVFSFTNNRLVPSVGLRYLWQHVDSYTAYNLDNADVNYGDMDENQLYANLGLDWYGDYRTESNWQIVPSLGLGVEQALTDNEFGNSMGVGSIIIPVTNSMDKTSVSARASIEFVKDSYALSAGYAGAYSSDTKNSSFYLQMKYFF